MKQKYSKRSINCLTMTESERGMYIYILIIIIIQKRTFFSNPSASLYHLVRGK